MADEKKGKLAGNVILSCGSTWHSHHQARAYWKAGLLGQFITGYARDTSLIDKIPTLLVTKIDLPRIVYYGFSRTFRKVPFDVEYYHDRIFGCLSGRKLRPCKLFHGYSNFALESMKIAKSSGAVVVWEGGCHPRAYQETYMTEAKNIGVNMPELVSERSASRMEKEIELADAIIVASNSAQKTYLEHAVPGSKIHIVPLGWSPSTFMNANKKPISKSVRLLYVGRVSAYKGINYLLDAFSQVRRGHGDSVSLDIVGPIDQTFADFKEKAPEGVRFHGRKMQTELGEIYSRADIFVFPSLIEGSAMVVYEAMGSGLPIVTTFMSGSVVREGLDGFIILERDVSSLVKRINLLVENQELRLEMGTNARTRALNFTWDTYGDRLIAAIREIYESSRSIRFLY